jgi:amino acid transporter
MILCLPTEGVVLILLFRVPIVEHIRLALSSNAAAITFNVMMLVNFFSALTGCMTSASRQSFSLARDGGLLFKRR